MSKLKEIDLRIRLLGYLTFMLVSCYILFCGPAAATSSSSSYSSASVKTRRSVGDEAEAVTYLQQLEAKYSHQCFLQTEKRWDYATNVNPQTEKASVEASNEFLAYQAQVQSYIKSHFPNLDKFSEAVRRELKYLALRGPGNMSKEHIEQSSKIGAEMESAYATAKVCKYENRGDPHNCPKFSLEPELTEILKTSNDFNELAYYWTAWHDAMGDAVSTSKYKLFIDLLNEYARANGFGNMGDYWAAAYDDGSADWTPTKFEEEMLSIWEDLRPYYNKLHAYVRMKLKKYPNLYPEEKQASGYLPANILGNMWGQDWTALDSKTKPYPDAPSLDATQAMLKQNYTVLKMFQVADEFFQGLGLLKMTDDFWTKSLFVKPEDQEVVCHASAEDLCLGKGSKDFRIKMCTQVNQDDLVTVHHEMGHIEYFMQYTDKHLIFRDGANPGFHEAIGDALALAVTTPKHLQCALKLDLGLDIDCQAEARTTRVNITETDINFLYRMGLDKFSFFPFAISMDSWRWGVFDGSIPESEYNSKWWEIRQKNQGIAPPSDRSGISGGLDAAAKYHIVANVEYIRYFISHILQFQFYEAMCIAAGEYDPENPNSKPLYQCDFAGSQEAGKKFGDMMKLGFSRAWPEALKVMTGSEKLSTKSLLNYFQPLFHYIDPQLQTHGEVPGFDTTFNNTKDKDKSQDGLLPLH